MSRPTTPRIVCATSLALGREAFETLGDVAWLPEAAIGPEAVRDADVLVTRSKVKVNDRLLEGSRLRFYGTATAGFDHVDPAALERRGIAWAQAPGSNANSVAEYVLAALARIGLDRGIDWTGRVLGIIGAGHVGSRLAALAKPFGLRVLLNDPPLRDRTGDAAYVDRDELLAASDLVSLHVPLTDDGPYPTRGLANARFFARMKRGAVFINASRGEVVDEPSFHAAAGSGAFSAVVLDVFAREPDIDAAMMARADLVSPHIAGYSYDGRVKGTYMVYAAACRALGVEPRWAIPAAASPTRLSAPARLEPSDLYRLITAAYDPAADDRRLRGLTAGQPMGPHFQGLRASYPERYEFPHFAVDGLAPGSPGAATLAALGFVVHSGG